MDAYICWSGYQYLLSGMVGIVLLLLQLSGAIILIKQRTEGDIAKSYPLLVWDIVLGWYYLCVNYGIFHILGSNIGPHCF